MGMDNNEISNHSTFIYQGQEGATRESLFKCPPSWTYSWGQWHGGQPLPLRENHYYHLLADDTCKTMVRANWCGQNQHTCFIYVIWQYLDSVPYKLKGKTRKCPYAARTCHTCSFAYGAISRIFHVTNSPLNAWAHVEYVYRRSRAMPMELIKFKTNTKTNTKAKAQKEEPWTHAWGICDRLSRARHATSLSSSWCLSVSKF